MAKNRGGQGARESRKAKRAEERNGATSAADPQVHRSTVDPYRTHGPAAVSAAVADQSAPSSTQPQGKAAKNAPKPASTLPSNPDRQRELQREQNSFQKFPSPELQKADEKRREAEAKEASKSEGRESSKGRTKSLDEVQAENEKATVKSAQATGQIDHAILNHPRSEHEHRVGAAAAHVEGPAPRRVDQIDDEAVILEQLRLEVHADNLYLMRRQEREREDGARQHVIDAINARLVEVQGAPILPE